MAIPLASFQLIVGNPVGALVILAGYVLVVTNTDNIVRRDCQQEETMKTQRFNLPAGCDQRKLMEHLARDYAVKAETQLTDNLVFYDTFDWRLYRQSLVLFRVGNRLLLRRLDDVEIIQEVEVEAQPVFVWDLPKGDLKAQLTPIVKMRALLKLAEIETSSTAYRVLNQAEKTVIWLRCEELRLSSTPDGPPLATYIGLKPVRGYPKQEARVVSRFEDMGLASGGAEDCYFKALEAAGKKPGAYSPKLRLKLSPEMRADEATKVILRFLLGVIKTNEAYVKQDIDTEFLHDFRVAVRRTRSALSQIKGVFPEDVTERFKRDFAYIGQLSNDLRDLDVYLLDAPRYRSLLPAFLRDDIEPLFELLRHRRTKALQEVIIGLNSQKYSRILQDWATFISQPQGDPPTASNASRPIVDLAGERIYKRYRGVIKSGNRILENSEDEMLHALRIECKKLRYLMEFFSSLFPAKEINELIQQLKKLQNNLGDFNDLCVQQEYLLNLAAEIPDDQQSQSRRTILAVGSLIGSLDAEKSRVKDSFAQTFIGFAAPANQKLFKTLFATTNKKRG